MEAKKVFEIPRTRVPLNISNKEYKPNTPNTNEYVRHTSACATGKIRMFIVNPDNTGKEKKVSKKTNQRKRRNREGKKEDRNTKAAANLAIILLNTIRNGGHNIKTTRMLNEYNLSPDNITQHIHIAKPNQITSQLLESIAQMVGIQKTPKVENLPTPKHWEKIMHTQRGRKWAVKMKNALRQIGTEIQGDKEIIQMRCEPTKGIHALLRTITTGTSKETDSAMVAVYTAILRANSARWCTQNTILDTAYARRGIITSKNTNEIYRRSHQIVPFNEMAQQVGKERENKEDDQEKSEECPNCKSERPIIQLACNKCKMCIECTNHTICKYITEKYAESLPKRLRTWVTDSSQTTSTRKKNKKGKPKIQKRHRETERNNNLKQRKHEKNQDGRKRHTPRNESTNEGV
jgi:hypothetical protein